jgi:hypothetical protein
MSDDVFEPASWRPHDWLRAAGHPFSLPILYREIKRGAIDARKIAGKRNTVILTSPRAYLEAQPRGSSPAPTRWGKK